MDQITAWLNSGEYLPPIMRDFHDQKDIFKAMHQQYENGNYSAEQEMPNWANGQCYVIDWFLWYMAGRGYTLQKNRKRIEFREFKPPKYPPLEPPQ